MTGYLVRRDHSYLQYNEHTGRYEFNGTFQEHGTVFTKAAADYLAAQLDGAEVVQDQHRVGPDRDWKYHRRQPTVEIADVTVAKGA